MGIYSVSYSMEQRMWMTRFVPVSFHPVMYQSDYYYHGQQRSDNAEMLTCPENM